MTVYVFIFNVKMYTGIIVDKRRSPASLKTLIESCIGDTVAVKTNGPVLIPR